MGGKKPLTLREEYLYHKLYSDSSLYNQHWYKKIKTEKNWVKRRRLKRLEKRYFTQEVRDHLKELGSMGLNHKQMFHVISHFTRRRNFTYRIQYHYAIESISYVKVKMETERMTDAELLAEML